MLLHFLYFREKELFREEVHSLEVVRDKLKKRTLELEDEIKKLRDTFEQEKSQMLLNNEDEVGYELTKKAHLISL